MQQHFVLNDVSHPRVTITERALRIDWMCGRPWQADNSTHKAYAVTVVMSHIYNTPLLL
jgi:hypothetical protein